MNSTNAEHLRDASPAEVLGVLESAQTLSPEELQAALVNAFRRIASLEREWSELGQAFRWLSNELNKSDRAT